MVKRVGNVFEKKTRRKVGRHKKNLNKDEREDIFDVIAREHPDL